MARKPKHIKAVGPTEEELASASSDYTPADRILISEELAGLLISGNAHIVKMKISGSGVHKRSQGRGHKCILLFPGNEGEEQNSLREALAGIAIYANPRTDTTGQKILYEVSIDPDAALTIGRIIPETNKPNKVMSKNDYTNYVRQKLGAHIEHGRQR